MGSSIVKLGQTVDEAWAFSTPVGLEAAVVVARPDHAENPLTRGRRSVPLCRRAVWFLPQPCSLGSLRRHVRGRYRAESGWTGEV